MKDGSMVAAGAGFKRKNQDFSGNMGIEPSRQRETNAAWRDAGGLRREGAADYNRLFANSNIRAIPPGRVKPPNERSLAPLSAFGGAGEPPQLKPEAAAHPLGTGRAADCASCGARGGGGTR